MNWKIALVLCALGAVGASSAVAGCGSDDCTRADDHMAECAVATSTSSSSSSSGMSQTVECSGTRLCQSQCINQFSCTDIQGNAPKFTSCLGLCLGK